MLKKTKSTTKIVFLSGSLQTNGKPYERSEKRMARVWSRHFHLAFERIFSDVPFLSSFRDKMWNLKCVRRERKKKKTRARLHKCWASHRIKKKTRDALHKCVTKHRINKRHFDIWEDRFNVAESYLNPNSAELVAVSRIYLMI
jgi:hypothetical protein